MDYLLQINTFIMGNLQYIILAMTGLILMALIVFININLKLAKLTTRYKKMMKGMEGENLESMLLAHINEVRKNHDKVEALSERCTKIQHELTGCAQKIGVVRFNAFEDTGSDLSFAIAVLDGENNGYVISSIFGRSESRTYAKPIAKGQSSYFLTDEEKAALQKSQEKLAK